MKITMYAIGSTGDVRPILLLGRELHRRGHEITVSAFSTFEQDVLNEGFRFAPLTGDIVYMMDNIMKPGINGVNYLLELEKSLRKSIPGMLDDLVRAAEGADAMICTFFGSMFYSIAEKFDIPCMQIQYAPVDPTASLAISSAPLRDLGQRWNRFSYKLGYYLISLLEKRYLTDWRIKNGMRIPPARTAPDYRIVQNRIPVVYALSDSLLNRPADWPDDVHMFGFWSDGDESESNEPLPSEVEAFLKCGDAPVYIGFGSMVSGNMELTMRIVVRAAKLSGVRVLLSGGWSGVPEDIRIPDNVCLCGNLPHDVIFPHCRAVVHHGGLGTTATGLRWGKPTLIIPFGGDQPIWGECIYRRHIGPRPISRSKMTPHRLARALTKLVSTPEFAKNAEKAARMIASENGIPKTADLFEKTVSEWKKENGHV